MFINLQRLIASEIPKSIGGSCLIHAVLIYPPKHESMEFLFDSTNFGEDEFRDMDTWKYTHDNSSELVAERKQIGIQLFREIGSETPVVITKIDKGTVTLSTLSPPDKKWATAWADRLWEHHLAYYKRDVNFDDGRMKLRDLRSMVRRGFIPLGFGY